MSLLAALASLVAALQGGDDFHRKVYAKAADSVVGIRAMAPLGERSGSGVVLDDAGLILTSYSIVPEGARNIRVWLRGPRFRTALLVATSRDHEISLLRLERPGPGRPAEMGDSDALRPGDPIYTLGNAANSIINNDAASFGVGVLSARYILDERRANSTWSGPILETTAAVNVGMEGSPLLDAEGRVVGIVTLNYSPHRFLGAAIPINLLKPALARLRESLPRDEPAAPGEPEAEGWIGFNVKDDRGNVVIADVERNSPAEKLGLAPGMRILGLGAKTVAKADDFRNAVQGLKAGSTLFLRIEQDGEAMEIKMKLEKRP